ncbi:MAG: acetyl-CoA carboxylase biotin carboxyl carrier protein [Thermoleophilaceae bacterium]|jgi:acetyl-CoA carboxylase biotin carboxyl carrier protein|nr:acetyl-CoA carboxylase biotin carboxyl carrier protein [Thermoleophilaceae bacterium]
MALTDDDVREILRLIDESDLDELRIETAEFKLHVIRGGAAAGAAPEAAAAAPAGDSAPASAPAADSAPASAATTISAPMPGTFYRSEGPGVAPFVDVGARVEPDTVVCIIEIMKMMNSVPAGVSGTIVEVCAEDAQLVGDGAPLFRVSS